MPLCSSLLFTVILRVSPDPPVSRSIQVVCTIRTPIGRENRTGKFIIDKHANPRSMPIRVARGISDS